MFIKLLYLIFGATQLSGMSQAAKETDISRLRATILKNYDVHARPVQKHTDTLEVGISFSYLGFEFDEQKGVLSLYLWTYMTWQDMHFAWNPLDYGNLTEITVGDYELWRPDIAVINNYDESEYNHFGSTLIFVHNDSNVWWVPPTKFQVGCVTDYRLWPYDKQSCQVNVSTDAHLGTEVDIVLNQNKTELFDAFDDEEAMTKINHQPWKRVSSSVQRMKYILYCCPEESFVDVVLTFNIERRSSIHTIAVTIVGLGIATMILISFWLDPFAQERIPLMLMVMLINSIYLQHMHRIIPNNGDTVPLAICFFRDSLIMVAYALAWTVLIRYIAKTKRNSPVPLPDFIQNLLSSFVGTILCLNPRPQSKGQSQRKAESTGDVSELVEESESNYQEDWEWLARLLDRITFFTYLFAYIIFIIAFL